MRFVAMAECGTHTLCYANPGSHTKGGLTLAEAVIDQAGMPVAADRNFYSDAFWQRAPSCCFGSSTTCAWRAVRNWPTVPI